MNNTRIDDSTLHAKMKQAIIDLAKQHFDMTDEDVSEMTEDDLRDVEFTVQAALAVTRKFTYDQVSLVLTVLGVDEKQRSDYLAALNAVMGVEEK